MKEIVISGMYSGEYLDANLGHEVINLFKADDGKHYYKMEKSLDIVFEKEELDKLIK